MVFELEEKSAVICVILLFGSSHNTTCNFEDIMKLSSNKDRSHAIYGKIEIISGKISNSEILNSGPNHLLLWADLAVQIRKVDKVMDKMDKLLIRT